MRKPYMLFCRFVASILNGDLEQTFSISRRLLEHSVGGGGTAAPVACRHCLLVV